MDLTLPDGHEVCWDFFVISKEIWRSFRGSWVCRDQGQADASSPRRPVPHRGATADRSSPDLADDHVAGDRAVHCSNAAASSGRQALLERYEQLEEARERVGHQATQRQTAHTVNDLIHADLDLGRTLQTIAKVLVEQAGFGFAEIKLSEPVTRSARFGDPIGDAPFVRLLEARAGRGIGQLTVEARPVQIVESARNCWRLSSRRWQWLCRTRSTTKRSKNTSAGSNG
jgi:hypothetical protein